MPTISGTFRMLSLPEKGRIGHQSLPMQQHERIPPHEFDPRLDAAIEHSMPLDPRIYGPPEQLAGDKQRLSHHSMNRHGWEPMGFPDSYDEPATISSRDSLEPEAFWGPVQAVNQPDLPKDDVRLAHMQTCGVPVPRLTRQQSPSQARPDGPPPQPSHSKNNPRVRGSRSVVSDSRYGNPSSLLGYSPTLYPVLSDGRYIQYGIISTFTVPSSVAGLASRMRVSSYRGYEY